MEKYCGYCGAKLPADFEYGYAEISTPSRGYDTQTGNPSKRGVYYIEYAFRDCPNLAADAGYPETADTAHLHYHYFTYHKVSKPEGKISRYWTEDILRSM